MIASVGGGRCVIFCNRCGVLGPTVDGAPAKAWRLARAEAKTKAGFVDLGGGRDACSACAGAIMAGT